MPPGREGMQAYCREKLLNRGKLLPTTIRASCVFYRVSVYVMYRISWWMASNLHVMALSSADRLYKIDEITARKQALA